MDDSFSPETSRDRNAESSEKGFTNDEIAVKWLYHFIKHSNSEPTSDWKLHMIDNHDSHESGVFIKLANSSHIRDATELPQSGW
jgi:hypothetical protein